MLVEYYLTQQASIQGYRRWFQDDYFDLFVWQDENEEIISFQLCYDRSGEERVLVWDNEKGFEHYQIDDGEATPCKNMAPVFLSPALFSRTEVIPQFIRASMMITPYISQFIMQKLVEYSRR